MALKVIGAGGPRTGTASLKVALETLGFGKCYHMEYLFNHPDQVKHWVELYETGSADFDTMFEGFQSTVDFPGCFLYKTFLQKYPDAKVILTVRDPEEWYESAMNTVYSATPQTLGQKLKLMKKMLLSARFRKIAKAFKLVKRFLWERQYRGQFKDKALAMKIFTDHNEEVKRTVPPEQLLVFSIKDGWEPLCKFLNVPVPNVPFIHKNKRDEFKETIKRMMDTGRGLELK